MTSIFQKREAVDYGTAITKYTASQWDEETKMLYFMGRKPQKYFDKYKDSEEFKEFIESKGGNLNQPLEELSSIASEELVSRIVDEEMLAKITENVIRQIKDNPKRNISSVRISSPFPLDETATNNTFAPALAAAVSAGLEAYLPQALEKEGIKNLKVISDLDPNNSSREEAILNIVNNQRGNTSNPKEGEEVETYMQRLVRQPVYSGKVDETSIYVPVDDFLVSQSTVAGLMNYIQSHGALTTNAVTGFKLFNGTEVLEPQQETIDLLSKALADKSFEVKTAGGLEAYQSQLNEVLGKVGLNVDFKEPSRTSLSNIETIFLAGYLSDGRNQEHKELFEKALNAIGTSMNEVSKGNSTRDVFDAPAGTLKGLENIFETTLEARKMMAEEKSPRYQDLVNKDAIIDYKGVTR